MARTPLLRTGIFIIILLVFLAITFNRRSDVTLLWRKAQRPYRAPLFSCQYSGVIQGEYWVDLHFGCSLEKHMQTVEKQANVDWNFTHVFPGSEDNGLSYYAANLDDVARDAIRADIAVDKIGCNRILEMDWGEETIELISSGEETIKPISE